MKTVRTDKAGKRQREKRKQPQEEGLWGIRDESRS